MNPTLYGFLLTTFAGLSTMIGTILIFIKVKQKNSIITAALSFAAGVMITVSLTDLIPESINALKETFLIFPTVVIMLIGVVSGIILSMTIDKYLPDNKIEVNHKKLYRIGLISMTAIILHNIPEGIATFMAGTNNATLGLSLAIAIALHNIPEGISISVPIYYGTGSRAKAFGYTLISALSEPLGAFLAFLFLRHFVNQTILGILFAVIAGIMLHISFYELLPTSRKYRLFTIRRLFLLLGILFMIVNHFLF